MDRHSLTAYHRRADILYANAHIRLFRTAESADTNAEAMLLYAGAQSDVAPLRILRIHRRKIKV